MIKVFSDKKMPFLPNNKTCFNTLELRIFWVKLWYKLLQLKLCGIVLIDGKYIKHVIHHNLGIAWENPYLPTSS